LNWARIKYSFPPGKLLMLQMNAFSSGLYLHWPMAALNLGVSASRGAGMIISTLFAVERRLNWDFAFLKIKIKFDLNLLFLP
jgi:hypothetical protein